MKSSFGRKSEEKARVVSDDIARELFRKQSWREINLFDEGTSKNGTKWIVADMQQFPVVEFLDGSSEVILPSQFEHEIPGKGWCVRTQVPLKLAWAMTVHKLQGMELDFCVVDCKDLFGYGMGYTAFSRAKTVLGMQIINFDPKKITADPLVLEFDAAIRHGQVDSFLQRCGLWFYPLLNYHELLEDICSKDLQGNHRSTDCRQFSDWLKQYGPLDTYKLEGGYKCPQRLGDWLSWHSRFFNVTCSSGSSGTAAGVGSGIAACDGSGATTVDLTGLPDDDDDDSDGESTLKKTDCGSSEKGDSVSSMSEEGVVSEKKPSAEEATSDGVMVGDGLKEAHQKDDDDDDDDELSNSFSRKKGSDRSGADTSAAKKLDESAVDMADDMEQTVGKRKRDGADAGEAEKQKAELEFEEQKKKERLLNAADGTASIEMYFGTSKSSAKDSKLT